MHVTEELRVLNEPHSGISYSAIDCEFNVNELTIYIEQHVFKQKHISNNVIYWSVDKISWPEAHRNLTLKLPLGERLSVH